MGRFKHSLHCEGYFRADRFGSSCLSSKSAFFRTVSPNQGENKPRPDLHLPRVLSAATNFWTTPWTLSSEQNFKRGNKIRPQKSCPVEESFQGDSTISITCSRQVHKSQQLLDLLLFSQESLWHDCPPVQAKMVFLCNVKRRVVLFLFIAFLGG